MAATEIKAIKLKNKAGEYLTPVLMDASKSIGDKAITKSMLAEDVQSILNGSATDANLQQIQSDITTLKGDSSVEGSVDNKIKTVCDPLSYAMTSKVEKADFDKLSNKVDSTDSKVSALNYAMATVVNDIKNIRETDIAIIQQNMIYYEEVTQA